MKKYLMVMAALVFLLSACGASAPGDAQGGVEILAPYAHAAGAGETSAAYMNIKNSGSEADTLLSASCDAVMMVQVMESTMEGDVMSMGDVPVIDIPAGSTVELNPGGYHIMLMDLKQELKAGDTIQVTLEFAKAGKVTLEVPILAPGDMP
jgi:copper(I)-binding protein